MKLISKDWLLNHLLFRLGRIPSLLSLFCLFCVLFRGKRGAVCGELFTFQYTSPYEHVQYNVSGP